ncbi:MAG: MerR family transcriptional regulator [Nevskiales bacterium]
MPKPHASAAFFSAQEAAKAAGISKATLLRWIKGGRIGDAAKRDRNGWRLFTDREVQRIRRVAQS